MLDKARDIRIEIERKTQKTLETRPDKKALYMRQHVQSKPQKTKPIYHNKFYFMEVILLWHATTKKARVILQKKF